LTDFNDCFTVTTLNDQHTLME